MLNPVQICGSSLGLHLQRHRLFESNLALMTPPCAHGWQIPQFAPSSNRHNLARVVNPFGTSSDIKLWRWAFEIDWMTRDEITQAIPPAYTELLGYQLLGRVLDDRSTIVEAA